ncbi:UNVERIFIED_CONTAM: hypothetical protein HDU68_000240 [Siphonaria sp. JEL0065]|nr:hypothetical protein HDU68_000240 [Siphonaria sp. JEL0065]
MERQPSTASGVRRKKQAEAEADLFRSKTVDKPNGISLIYNNMTGIGIIQTASTFQQSGWLLTIVFFVLYMVISSFCALFIVEAMQAIPGNRYFTGNVEYGTLINFYFGPTAHILGQMGLYGALQTMAIGSLIQSSQTMDHLFVDMFGKTCGVSLGYSNLTSSVVDWICVNDHGPELSPFGAQYMLLTAGYLAAFVIIIPMCIYPLEDIVWIQTLTFAITMIVFVEWIVVSGISGLHLHYVPALGDSSNYAGLVGVVMLNFAFVQTIPSWINVRRPDVSIQKTIWMSSACGLSTYILTGLLPALAYKIPVGSNLIAVMQTADGTLSKVFGYLFSIMVLMMSAPVLFVITRSNLDQNFKLPQVASIGLSYVVPWVLTIPFATGTFLTEINIWGSLVFVSVANFVVPLVIYLKALWFRKAYNEKRFLTTKQRDLLRVIHGKGINHGHVPEHHESPVFSLSAEPSVMDGQIPSLVLQEREEEKPQIGLLGGPMNFSPTSSPIISASVMALGDVAPAGTAVGLLSVPILVFSSSETSLDKRVTMNLTRPAISVSSPASMELPTELADLDLELEGYLLDDVPDPDAEEEYEPDSDGVWFNHLFGHDGIPHDVEKDGEHGRRNSWGSDEAPFWNNTFKSLRTPLVIDTAANLSLSSPPRSRDRSPFGGNSPSRGLSVPLFAQLRRNSGTATSRVQSFSNYLQAPSLIPLPASTTPLAPSSLLVVPVVTITAPSDLNHPDAIRGRLEAVPDIVVRAPSPSPIRSNIVSPISTYLRDPTTDGFLVCSDSTLPSTSPISDLGNTLRVPGLDGGLWQRIRGQKESDAFPPSPHDTSRQDSHVSSIVEMDDGGLIRVPQRFMTVSSQVAEETYARAALHLATTSRGGNGKHKVRPMYKAFRAIPKSFPISPRRLAILCMVVTCLTALTNVVYTIVITVNSSS